MDYEQELAAEAFADAANEEAEAAATVAEELAALRAALVEALGGLGETLKAALAEAAGAEPEERETFRIGGGDAPGGSALAKIFGNE